MYSTKHQKKAKSGSVQIKLSNGRLQLVFSFGGRRRYISTGLGDSPFNRMQAQQKALEVERDIAYGQFDPDNLEKYKVGVSLSTAENIDSISKPALDLPELWSRYTDARKTDKSPSTVRMYQWVSNHLDRCPHKLPNESQAIFDWLGANVPPNSRQRVLMHLSACCRWASKSGLIEGNPFDGLAGEVKVLKAGSEEDEILPFTRDERDRIIEAFRGNRYYSRYAPLVEFLFLTGARPSEALALQWKHIGKTHITFERGLVYSGKGFVVKDGLKTQQERRFPINAQLATLLNNIKPTDAGPDTLVFSGPEGGFINWNNFNRRAWSRVLESLPDIDPRSPYQMRHTFCSLCREQNIPSVQLGKWVGNSAAMIDRVYAKAVENVTVPEL